MPVDFLKNNGYKYNGFAQNNPVFCRLNFPYSKNILKSDEFLKKSPIECFEKKNVNEENRKRAKLIAGAVVLGAAAVCGAVIFPKIAGKFADKAEQKLTELPDFGRQDKIGESFGKKIAQQPVKQEAQKIVFQTESALEEKFIPKKNFYPPVKTSGISVDSFTTFIKADGQKFDKYLTDSTKNKLQQIAKEDPELYKTVRNIMDSTYIARDCSISPYMLNNFVLELCNPKIKPLLDFAHENNVHFNLMRHFSTAQYAESLSGEEITKEIFLFELTQAGKIFNTVASLPHELSHAFDYSADASSIGLTFKKMPVYMKDESGNYVITKGFAPNTKKFGKPAFLKNLSFSKEFEDAVNKDLLAMLQFDEKNGAEAGHTLDKILENKRLAYYFGIDENESYKKGYRLDKFCKELFAQLGAYATVGKTTSKDFDNVIEKFFPNSLAFVDGIIPKAANY